MATKALVRRVTGFGLENYSKNNDLFIKKFLFLPGATSR